MFDKLLSLRTGGKKFRVIFVSSNLLQAVARLEGKLMSGYCFLISRKDFPWNCVLKRTQEKKRRRPHNKLILFILGMSKFRILHSCGKMTGHTTAAQAVDEGFSTVFWHIFRKIDEKYGRKLPKVDEKFRKLKENVGKFRKLIKTFRNSMKNF